jgi:methionine-rich copper-binding protein CopC
VARLLDEDLAAGVYRVKWDGTSDGGSVLASGVYHAVLQSAGGRSATRLIMLK